MPRGIPNPKPVSQLVELRDDDEVVDVEPEPEPEPAPEPDVEPEPAPSVRPKPENELTVEQRRIRDLENQLALERGKKDPEMELEKPATPDGEVILIHFLDDGHTALGQIWRRGQELEFEPGSQAYQDTCDRLGQSWLALRDDEFAQVEKYGRVVFRSGPWPGKSYTEAAKVAYESLKPLRSDGAPVKPPTEDELAAVAQAEARRARRAPRLPVH